MHQQKHFLTCLILTNMTILIISIILLFISSICLLIAADYIKNNLYNSKLSNEEYYEQKLKYQISNCISSISLLFSVIMILLMLWCFIFDIPLI